MKLNSVTIHVEGTDPDEMELEALRMAARFYDLPESQLEVGLWNASPESFVGDEGGTWREVSKWEADITVSQK